MKAMGMKKYKDDRTPQSIKKRLDFSQVKRLTSSQLEFSFPPTLLGPQCNVAFPSFHPSSEEETQGRHSKPRDNSNSNSDRRRNKQRAMGQNQTTVQHSSNHQHRRNAAHWPITDCRTPKWRRRHQATCKNQPVRGRSKEMGSKEVGNRAIDAQLSLHQQERVQVHQEASTPTRKPGSAKPGKRWPSRPAPETTIS